MMWVYPIVIASTMIAQFNFGRKVRCHTEAVENVGLVSCACRPESGPRLREHRRVI
jgi:hypothetical protein